jgi:Domain of unknown function (DUF4372)
MAWILLRFERLAAFETRERAHAMLHQNSVFHSLPKHVPWSELEQIVEKYGSDELARELTTKRHLIALLYGQFSGATSLREIVTGLESHETRLYHLGAAPVKRSTMSDADSQRPWHVFAELATTMLMQAHRGLRRASKDAVRHHLQLQPRLLQGRALRRLADRLDRGDRALADAVDRGDAGPRRRAVDMHGAGAAQGLAATELGPGHAEHVAQHPQQRGVAVDIDLMGCR